MSKQEKFKDVLIRALKTLWQAMTAYIIINIHVIADAITTDLEAGGFETLKSVGLSVGVGAIAAGLSALYNGVLKPLMEKKTEDNYSEDEMGVVPELQDEEEADIAELFEGNTDEEEDSIGEFESEETDNSEEDCL